MNLEDPTDPVARYLAWLSRICHRHDDQQRRQVPGIEFSTRQASASHEKPPEDRYQMIQWQL